MATLTYNISQGLIDRYSAGPQQTKINQAKALRLAVENALGTDYDVFLQGSYRNNTGVADLNDLDVVALAKTVHSTRGGPPAEFPISWDEIFRRVEDRLEADYRFAGRVTRSDKCVKVGTDLALDVVPAIYRGDPATDPIEIYSFRELTRRDNYPRDHYANGVVKNSTGVTDGFYKPTVRLMKRWARNVLPDSSIAPSFYLECAVHQAPNSTFHDYLPLNFAAVGLAIHNWDRNTVIHSVAGDKDILVPSEWHPDQFEEFKRRLLPSLTDVVEALDASTTAEADRLWRTAFGE